ncbi:hypothetical protein D3C76_47840 [compost metagenome]
MNALTITTLRTELLSLRHPGNEEPGATRRFIAGLTFGLVAENVISIQQYGILRDLAANAHHHHYRTPWPEVKEWTLF